MTTDTLAAITPADPDLRACKMLTINEAAEALAVSRQQIYRMAARQHNALPIVHIGRSARVPLAGLEKWVERMCRAEGVK